MTRFRLKLGKNVVLCVKEVILPIAQGSLGFLKNFRKIILDHEKQKLWHQVIQFGQKCILSSVGVFSLTLFPFLTYSTRRNFKQVLILNSEKQKYFSCLEHIFEKKSPVYSKWQLPCLIWSIPNLYTRDLLIHT